MNTKFRNSIEDLLVEIGIAGLCLYISKTGDWSTLSVAVSSGIMYAPQAYHSVYTYNRKEAKDGNWDKLWSETL